MFAGLLGLLLLVGGIVLTGGLSGSVGTAVKFLRRRVLKITPPALLPREPSLNLGTFEGEELEVSGATKRFGGLKAVSDVSIRARPGQVTAIIGPNGSGKTSLLNIVSGFYRPDEGAVRLGQKDLTRQAPATIALAGVARTFQTPLVPTGLTCLQVVASARYARDQAGLLPAILRLPAYRRRVREDRSEAERLLAATGLAHLAGAQAADLPLGTRRLLEVARALAARPALVLLDEPASGLDVDDVRRLGRLIRATAAAGATVIVIEHNFQLMLEIADVINVLGSGRLIATGKPAEIRSNPAVLESYLGERAQIEAVPAAPDSQSSGEVEPPAPASRPSGGPRS